MLGTVQADSSEVQLELNLCTGELQNLIGTYTVLCSAL